MNFGERKTQIRSEAVPAMTRVEGYFITGLESHRVAEWQAAHQVSPVIFGDKVRALPSARTTFMPAGWLVCANRQL